MLTVGEIRKAIEGLADESHVLFQTADSFDLFVDVEFDNVSQEDGLLLVRGSITIESPDDEENDDDEDNDDQES